MKKYIISLALLLVVFSLTGQEEIKYRRSSLYSILIQHPAQKFHKEMTDVFYTIPIPDKFNNHDLSVKVLTSDATRKENEDVINQFIDKNALARHMIGKWFDRDPETGFFDMNLIAERGQYDASYFDVNIAKMSARGTAQLADAGEELIGNTYLIMNDIKYIDKSEGAKIAGGVMMVLGTLASAYTGKDIYSDLGNLTGNIVATIKGFKVTVTSYLYRLEWNDEIAGKLYNMYYINGSNFDADKKMAFDSDNLFKLKYIGKQSVNSGNISIVGINLDEPEQMIRKVCTRAIDKSIVELQREHKEFRVKTPIFAIAGGSIKAKVGLKEGVSPDSKFEVLEQSINVKGITQYKRVGIIKPMSGKIWDNQYMAAEENAVNAKLTATEFTKVSGGDFAIGMLIQEIK